MEIREYKTYNEPDILRLYASVGWTAYTDYPDVLRKGFENSMLTLAAYEDDQLLGIIRAVGDGHTVVFVQDILVFPEHQRKGIGSTLLQQFIVFCDLVPMFSSCFDKTTSSVSLNVIYQICSFHDP